MAELKKYNKLRRKRRNARLINYKMEESGHKNEQVSGDDRDYQLTEEEFIYSSDDPDNVRHRIHDWDDYYDDDDVIHLSPPYSPIDWDQSPLIPDKNRVQADGNSQENISSSHDLHSKHSKTYKNIPHNHQKGKLCFKHSLRPSTYKSTLDSSDSETETIQSKFVKLKAINNPRKLTKQIQSDYGDGSQTNIKRREWGRHQLGCKPMNNELGCDPDKPISTMGQELRHQLGCKPMNNELGCDPEKPISSMGQDRFKHSITIIEHSTDASETLPKECVDKIVNFISNEVGNYGFTINSLVSNWFKPNTTKSTKLNNHFVYFSKNQ